MVYCSQCYNLAMDAAAEKPCNGCGMKSWQDLSNKKKSKEKQEPQTDANPDS